MCLYAQRRFAECAQTYERMLDLDPRDPSLYVRQAEAYRRAGARHEAITAYWMAAELLEDQGNEARARAALKAALELNPRHPEINRALGRLTPLREDSARVGALVAPGELFEFPEGMELPPAWKATPAGAEPLPPSRPEVRRLSENTLAVRAAPGLRWWVVSSRTPLLAYEVDDLELAMEKDLSLEVTFQP